MHDVTCTMLSTSDENTSTAVPITEEVTFQHEMATHKGEVHEAHMKPLENVTNT